jgi:hypothetical protein
VSKKVDPYDLNIDPFATDDAEWEEILQHAFDAFPVEEEPVKFDGEMYDYFKKREKKEKKPEIVCDCGRQKSKNYLRKLVFS